MNKLTLSIALALTLLSSLVAGTSLAGLVQANPYTPLHLPEITINSDGSITPQTDYINQAGNVYTLLADINSLYSVKIECSDIIFDGMGHSINTIVEGVQSIDGYPAMYTDPSVYVFDAKNVVIRNLSAFSSNIYAIYLLDCSQCQLIGITTEKSDCISIKGDSNLITKCNGGVCVFDGTNNKILRNNITNVFLASPCQLYENNFFLSDKPDLIVSNIWDNGSVGNYWNNYALRYLNATEIENSGIGNTSYIIEKGDYSTRAYPNVANIDYHPLFYPYDIEHETISFPTPSSTIPELPWLAIVPLLLSLFTVALVLMHRKKR